MSNVSLYLGGRTYSVACAAGEEAHIAELGRNIDAKVTSSGLGKQSETRMLLFVALMLADELHEKSQPQDDAEVSPEFGPEFGQRLGAIATSLENLAARLERTPDDD